MFNSMKGQILTQCSMYLFLLYFHMVFYFKENTWRWLSGPVLTYSNWLNETPNEGYIGNCLFMVNYEDRPWADALCTSTFYPLCMKLSNMDKP